MTVVRLSRRLVTVGAVSGLSVAAVGLSLTAAAAGPCPTYTDPAGDSAYVQNVGTPDGNALLNADDDLDLLDVSHSVDAGVFTTVVHVKALGPTGPYFNNTDRFTSAFTVGGKAVTVVVDRDYNGQFPTAFGGPGLAPGVVTGKLTVAGTTSAAKVVVKEDFKANTITTSVAVADLEKAVGAPLTGLPFSAMSAGSAVVVTPSQSPGSLARPVDTATAPASASYVFGGSCSGGSIPAPTATSQPTEEPTADPTGSPTPEPTGSASPDPSDEPTDTPEGSTLLAQPRAGCFAFKDAAGDAKPGRAPLTSPNNDADLDLTEIAVRSTDDAVQVFSKVATLGTAPTTPVFTGHSFTAAFSVGGKAVSATATKAGAATGSPAAVKATAAFDTKASNVVFTFPKADLETVAGSALTTLTGLTVTSNATNAAGSFDGDTATGAKPEEKTYAYGDNTCFLPPVGSLQLTAPSTAEYGDRVVVTGTLVDTAKEAVPGVKVHLSLTGEPEQVAVTDADGHVAFPVTLTGKAGAKTVALTFLGTDTVGPVSTTAALTEAVEKTVLKAVAGKGSVTATLTDNDKSPVAGQLVVFTVGSKVTKVKTNAKGVAVLTRQTAGTTVKVGFAAVSGYYSASPTVSAKVL